MKKIKIYIIIVLAFSLLVSGITGGVQAADMRRLEYLDTYNAMVIKTGTTTIKIEFEVEGQNIMDEIGATKIIVQRSSDNKNWTNVITRDSTSYPQYIDEDTATHSYSFNYYGTAGYYYRVKVTFYASLNSGSETRTGYSNSVKLG